MKTIHSFGAVVLLGLVCVVGLFACAGGGDEAETEQANLGSGHDLWGTSWRLEDLAGTEALDDVEATLSFPEAGQVQGNGSCNRFTGTVTISGDSISFGPLAVTKMACPEPVMAQEDLFLKALNEATVFDRRDPFLFLHASWEATPIRLTREE